MMAEHVTQNIDWIVDDDGNLVGYQKPLNARVSVALDGGVSKYLPRLAIAGASIVNRGSYSNTANQGYGPHNWTQWLLAMLGHKFDLVSMAGVGGRQVTVVDSNFDTEVGAYEPDVVILGSDAVGNYMYNGSGTVADSMGYVKSIHAKCKKLGARLIVFGLPPNVQLEAAQDASFANTNKTLEYNRALTLWASTQPDVTFVDFSGYTDVTAADGRYQTTTGATTTTAAWTHDGTHPQPRAAIKLAQLIRDVIDAKDLPAPMWLASPCNADPARAFINPMGIGTTGSKSGGATGDVAANWTLTGSSAAVGSKVARADLGPNATWQKIVITAAAADVTLAIAGTGVAAFPAGVAAGTPVMALVEVMLNAAPTNLRGIQSSLAFNGSATTIQGMLVSAGGGFASIADVGPYIPQGEPLWIATAVALVPANATGVGSLTLTFAKGAGGNLTADISIGRVMLVPKAALPNVVSAQTVP